MYVETESIILPSMGRIASKFDKYALIPFGFLGQCELFVPMNFDMAEVVVRLVCVLVASPKPN